jgi:hypothetical protein
MRLDATPEKADEGRAEFAGGEGAEGAEAGKFKLTHD